MSAVTRPAGEEDGLPIAAVEQATGIARATLRIWERRYGFPQPGRDRRGERSYPADQVRKLQLVADLMARGQRPGRLVQLTEAQLDALAGRSGGRSERTVAAVVADPVVEPLRRHDVAAVARLMEEGVRELGLAGFITERMVQMNVNVGLAWQRGELEVYEEHLYTELAQQVVRAQVAGLAPLPEGRPRVLLATFPDEPHTLGLLMAQAMLALERCRCTSLGARVPVGQLITATRVLRADILGLSFTGCANPSHVLRGLEQLRCELGAQVAIWTGGSAPVLARQRLPGVKYIAHIREVPRAVAQWREAWVASPA